MQRSTKLDKHIFKPRYISDFLSNIKSTEKYKSSQIVLILRKPSIIYERMDYLLRNQWGLERRNDCMKVVEKKMKFRTHKLSTK